MLIVSLLCVAAFKDDSRATCIDACCHFLYAPQLPLYSVVPRSVPCCFANSLSSTSDTVLSTLLSIGIKLSVATNVLVVCV